MKSLIVICVFLIAVPVHAAGPNDGIYQVVPASNPFDVWFGSLHQNGDVIIYVDLEPDDYSWSAWTGIRVGNQVTAVLAASELAGDAEIVVTFNGDGTASAELRVCSPGSGSVCLWEAGDTFTLTKVF